MHGVHDSCRDSEETFRSSEIPVLCMILVKYHLPLLKSYSFFIKRVYLAINLRFTLKLLQEASPVGVTAPIDLQHISSQNGGNLKEKISQLLLCMVIVAYDIPVLILMS